MSVVLTPGWVPRGRAPPPAGASGRGRGLSIHSAGRARGAAMRGGPAQLVMMTRKWRSSGGADGDSRAAAPSHAPERAHDSRLVSPASESAVVGVGPKALAPHREKAGVSRGPSRVVSCGVGPGHSHLDFSTKPRRTRSALRALLVINFIKRCAHWLGTLRVKVENAKRKQQKVRVILVMHFRLGSLMGQALHIGYFVTKCTKFCMIILPIHHVFSPDSIFCVCENVIFYIYILTLLRHSNVD